MRKETNRKRIIKWLWLITVAVFFASLIVQVYKEDERIYGPNAHYGSEKTYQVLPKAHAPTDSPSRVEVEAVRDTPKETGKLFKTSCYTGIESHGANGRNPWSVATYQFPQGTKLWIEGFGERVVETVTSRKYADRVDIWFGETQADHDRCWDYGTQYRLIKVIE